MHFYHIILPVIVLCNTVFAEINIEEGYQTKLELIDMDLLDLCEDMAKNLRESLIEQPVNFTEKVRNISILKMH